MLLLLIDAHPLHRQALTLLFECAPGLDLLATWDQPMPSPGLEAIPDVVVLGQPPQQDKADLWAWIAAVRGTWPAVPCLVLGTPYERDRGLSRSAVAVHWRPRQTTNLQLLQAVEDLAQGKSRRSLDFLASEFTPTELALWQGLAQGSPLDQLAQQLGLRLATAQATRRNLMDKLDAFTLWGLRHQAHRRGWKWEPA
jgi:DNA-binding NarL/FixJ family response regulator